MAQPTAEQIAILGLDQDEVLACIEDRDQEGAWYVARVIIERVDCSGTIPYRERVDAIDMKSDLSSPVGAADDIYIQSAADRFGISKLSYGLRCARFVTRLLRALKPPRTP